MDDVLYVFSLWQMSWLGSAYNILCCNHFYSLRGKIPVGTQRFGSRQGEVEMEEAGGRGRGKEKEKEQKLEETQQDLEHTHMEDLPAAVRWVSLLGINAWFTKKWRELTPAVPIVLVSAFVTALVQIIGNPGLFAQLAHGFMSLQNPVTASNWLLTKDAW